MQMQVNVLLVIQTVLLQQIFLLDKLMTLYDYLDITVN